MQEEREQAFSRWLHNLKLVPAIQPRREIGILAPDEALFLIGRVMEAVMEFMRDNDPCLRVYGERMDALEPRLCREHEAAHGCTLEDGCRYSDDGWYFEPEEALEESDEYGS